MAAQKGHKKWGGRQKGTPNKKTQELLEKCEAKGIDVFDAMLELAVGAKEPSVRFDRLRVIAEYIYPKRKSIEHSGEIGLPEPAIKEESVEGRISRIKAE